MTYVCPSCGDALERERCDLVCSSCGTYPDRGGFYDFLGDDKPENDALVSLFDAVSTVYETPVWYPFGTRLATGGRLSVEELVERVSARVGNEQTKKHVDVACGTGLFARRLAHDVTVYGVDASSEMLRRAVHNARREGVALELARGDAGALPYADDSFDTATCCGALHILPEPEETVEEIGRVVGSDGVFVFTTLVGRGIFSSRATRRTAELYGMHVFDDAEIDSMLDAAGFDRLYTERDSSLVTVTARRR